MTYLDLTHLFTANMPTYPGDQPSKLERIELENEECNDHRIQTGMHVGTHIDAPLHMLKGGKKISDYPVDHFFGQTHLVDARGKEVVDAEILEGIGIQKNDMIFVMTGHYKKFSEPDYYFIYPKITPSFATKIAELGVKIVGIDTPSPDQPPYEIHKLWFKNDILIIENLNNLEALLDHKKFHAIVLPAKFEAEAAPVRVVAQLL